LYLYRNKNGTYYCRITLPKPLRDRGFPFAVKCSLGTNSRTVGIERNAICAIAIRRLWKTPINQMSVNEFNHSVRITITKIRQEYFKEADTKNLLLESLMDLQEPPIAAAVTVRLGKALEEFLESKRVDDILNRTLRQFELRVGHFILWAKNCPVQHISPKMAMLYRNELLSQKRSYKTSCDYLSSVRQFFNWCVILEYCQVNPFSAVKMGKKPARRRDDERKRWTSEQLDQIFSFVSPKRSRSDRVRLIQDYWIPLLCLYGGLRPSEACQLTVKNFYKAKDVDVMKIDVADHTKSLKTDNAYRVVPVHSHLIKLGFFEYLEVRRRQGKTQIFDEVPSGEDGDWATNFTRRFGRHLTKAGFESYERPTAYGMRHTFIDELQQQGVEENVVAELVGHAKLGITFGRYGKRVNVTLLKEKIELLPADLITVIG